MIFNLLTWPVRWWIRRKLKRDIEWTAKYISPEPRITLVNEHGHTIGSATQAELDEAQEVGKKIFPWPVESRFKEFSDGQVGEDITNLDAGNIDELRRIYGKSPYLTDEMLQQWAADVREGRRRADEVRERIWAIEAQGEKNVVDDGYRPAGGYTAGTSPKTGITLPPKVEDVTTREWCDLKLEQAYGVGRMPSILAADAAGNRAVGFSMKNLNALRIRAEQRDPTLSAYDIAVLRSRGLV